MDMKNTMILLIFLLSVLGIILGIICTEGNIDNGSISESKEIINEHDNGTITIIIEPENKNNIGNILNKN